MRVTQKCVLPYLFLQAFRRDFFRFLFVFRIPSKKTWRTRRVTFTRAVHGCESATRTVVFRDSTGEIRKNREFENLKIFCHKLGDGVLGCRRVVFTTYDYVLRYASRWAWYLVLFSTEKGRGMFFAKTKVPIVFRRKTKFRRGDGERKS